jgi:hypothetical protein
MGRGHALLVVADLQLIFFPLDVRYPGGIIIE